MNPYYASVAARHQGVEPPLLGTLRSPFMTGPTAVESRPFPPPDGGRSRWEVALESLHNTIEGSRTASVRGYTSPHLEHVNRAAVFDQRAAELAAHAEGSEARARNFAAWRHMVEPEYARAERTMTAQVSREFPDSAAVPRHPSPGGVLG